MPGAKLNPDGTRAMRFVNPHLKVRTHRGATAVGDKMYGAPGGSPTSQPVIFSYRVADELAREIGTDALTAHRILAGFGRVAQRMILHGQPVGIPHLGTLIVREYSHRDVRGLPYAKTPGLRFIRRLTIHVPRGLRIFFRDNLTYTGRIQDHEANERAWLKKYLHTERKSRSTLKHRDYKP